MPRLPAQLLYEQEGVFSLEQAVSAGVTTRSVRAQVAQGRWSYVLPRIYVAQNVRPTYVQMVWAGALYAGPGAFVSHDSAIWLADRTAAAPSMVHVTLPYERAVRRQSGLVIHRSRVAQAVHESVRPARADVARAVIEAASVAPSQDRAVALVARAVQRRLTTPSRLTAVTDLFVTLPRRALLREVIAMSDEGAHSIIEVRFAQVCRGHRLPEPQRQLRRGKAVVDADFQGLVVEVDGRLGHLTADSWMADMFRDNLHAIAGRTVLRFPGAVLLTRPYAAAHVTAAGLRLRGWTGQLHCPPGCPGFPAADAYL